MPLIYKRCVLPDPQYFALKSEGTTKRMLTILTFLLVFFNIPNYLSELIPPKDDLLLSSRWLISSSDWGVLGTIRWGGKIFTNVVSYSDGINSQFERQNSTGVPYFYLTKMDETARDIKEDPIASFSVSAKSADVDGRCGAVDAQEPPCARITLMGKVIIVKSKKEREFARAALFSKHSAMERWPEGHEFDFYKLVISEIFFLNDYGGATPIRVKDYLSARLNEKKLSKRTSSSTSSAIVTNI